MADQSETHYVARLVVERVDKVTKPAFRSGEEPRVTRDVIEVGNFTVKADALDVLKGRIQNHVGLIDE
jgi:hypothetical protein